MKNKDEIVKRLAEIQRESAPLTEKAKLGGTAITDAQMDELEILNMRIIELLWVLGNICDNA